MVEARDIRIVRDLPLMFLCMISKLDLGGLRYIPPKKMTPGSASGGNVRHRFKSRDEHRPEPKSGLDWLVHDHEP